MEDPSIYADESYVPDGAPEKVSLISPVKYTAGEGISVMQTGDRVHFSLTDEVRANLARAAAAFADVSRAASSRRAKVAACVPFVMPSPFPIPTQNAARLFWWLDATVTGSREAPVPVNLDHLDLTGDVRQHPARALTTTGRTMAGDQVGHIAAASIRSTTMR